MKCPFGSRIIPLAITFAFMIPAVRVWGEVDVELFKGALTTPTPNAFNFKARDFEFGASSSFVLYYFDIRPTDADTDDTFDPADVDTILEYDFDPVYLLSLDGYARWKTFGLGVGYKTNRLFGGGGTIGDGSDALTELTKSEIISEVIKLSLKAFNFNMSFRSVLFDVGRVDVIDASTNERRESGQVDLSIHDFEITYGFSPFGDHFPLTISPGYKYMSYSLPRVVYRYDDVVEGERDSWVYAGESDPQQVRTTSHMGGVLFDYNTDMGDGRYNVVFSSGIFIGPNRTTFVIDGETREALLFSVVGRLKLGASMKLIDKRVVGRLNVLYDLDFIDTRSAEVNVRINDDYSESTTKYLFGSTDYYHGISIMLSFVF